MESKISSKKLSNDEMIVIPTISVMNDARFRAGRQMIESGTAGENAIQMFGILVEEAQEKYGNNAIETAACYYEYGNALFRTSARMKTNEKTETIRKRSAAAEAADEKTETIRKRSAAAEAAVKRMKMTTATIEKNSQASLNPKYSGMSEDIELALEMMENSFSIMYDFTMLNTKTCNHLSWCQFEIPRVLCGIGDLYSFLERHADAADAYIRALPYRESILEKFTNDIYKMPVSVQLDYLKARRLYTEVHVLIAEELLAHPSNLDVVVNSSYDEKQKTKKTEKSNNEKVDSLQPIILMKKSERIEFTKGYYEKGRDELQETVYLMGKIASQTIEKNMKRLEREKEDVCFLATILMGIGNQIADLDQKK